MVEPSVKLPIPAEPGAIVPETLVVPAVPAPVSVAPEFTVTAPTVPAAVSVAPEFTVIAVLAAEPVTFNVPPATVVAPE